MATMTSFTRPWHVLLSVGLLASLGLPSPAAAVQFNGYATPVGNAPAFSNPVSVAVDPAGNAFVVDAGASPVFWEVPRSGAPAFPLQITNLLPQSYQGVAADSQGNLYIGMFRGTGPTLISNLITVNLASQSSPSGPFAWGSIFGIPDQVGGRSVIRSVSVDWHDRVVCLVSDPAEGNFAVDIWQPGTSAAVPLLLNFDASQVPSGAAFLPSFAFVENNRIYVAGPVTEPAPGGQDGTLTDALQVQVAGVTTDSIQYNAQQIPPLSFRTVLDVPEPANTLTAQLPFWSAAADPASTIFLSTGFNPGLINAYQAQIPEPGVPSAYGGDFFQAYDLAVTADGRILFVDPTLKQLLQVPIMPAAQAVDLGPAQTGEGTGLTLPFTFNAQVQLGSILATTLGQGNQDFTIGSGGLQGGATELAGATGTVTVNFDPKAAGVRNGALILTDSNQNVLVTVNLKGTANEPQAAFVSAAGRTPVTDHPSGQSSFAQAVFSGLAADAGGTLYIPDSAGGTIWKLVPNGSGYTADPLWQGTLPEPLATALDGAGNLYIACGYVNNQSILYKAPTVPALGSPAPVLAYGLVHPQGLAVDAGNNLYVAIANSSASPGDVQKLIPAPTSPNGYLLTSLTASGATFGNPVAVAVDAVGDVFVADQGNPAATPPAAPQVWKLVPSNSGYTQIPVVTGLTLMAPSGVAVDGAGYVYITDSGLGEVLFAAPVEPTGSYAPFAATSYTLQTLAPSLDAPFAVALGGLEDVFIAESGGATGASLVLKADLADPPTLVFPPTAVGYPALPQTLTVLNTGSQTLAFPSSNPPSFTSPNATFTVTSGPVGHAFSLAPGGSQAYTFGFTPKGTGVDGATLVFVDTTLGLDVVQEVNLEGIGTQPVRKQVQLSATQTKVQLDLSQPGVSGGTYALATSAAGESAPPGLSLDAATGMLTGTPTAPGTFTFTVVYQNPANPATDSATTVTLTIPPGQATVTLGKLVQTFDFKPRPVTTTTQPPNLKVTVAYSTEFGWPLCGPPWLPGKYKVVATIQDPFWQGSASGILEIRLF